MEQTLRLKKVLQRDETVPGPNAPSGRSQSCAIRRDNRSAKAALCDAVKHSEAEDGVGQESATCPLIEWYKFYKCDITTCKNFTRETKHRCLELDRKKPEGVNQFSESELNLYKYKHKQISTRLVQVHRKNAIQSVKRILVLHRFVVWISENFKPSGSPFTYQSMRKLEQAYPLKIKRIGFKNWMWEYVLDEDVWSTFTCRYAGESRSFNVHQLLEIKLERFEALLKLTKPERK